MLTLLKRLGTAVTTPASGKITLFADTTTGAPRYMDDAGATHPLTGDAVNALTNSAGTVTIDCALGDYFTLALSANVTSITFSNLPPTGKAQTIRVRITQDATGSRTATWPASFKWAGGVAGVLSTPASSVDMLTLTTFDQGTRWEAALDLAFA